MDLVLSPDLVDGINSTKFSIDEQKIFNSFNELFNDGVSIVSCLNYEMINLQRNIDVNSEIIIKTVKSQKQKLDQLGSEIGNIKAGIEECGQNNLLALRQSELRIEENELEIIRIKNESDSAEREKNYCKDTFEDAKKQFDAEKENLDKHKRNDKELNESQDNEAKVGIASVGAAGAFALAGLLFPPLEIVAIVGVIGGLSNVVTSSAIIGIQQILKNSQEKLNDLQSKLDSTKSQMEKKEKEFTNAQEKILIVKNNLIFAENSYENERKKPEIFRKIIEFITKFQVAINTWRETFDQIINIYNIHQNRAITNIQRIKERNNRNFLIQIKNVLQQNEKLFIEYKTVKFILQISE